MPSSSRAGKLRTSGESAQGPGQGACQSAGAGDHPVRQFASDCQAWAVAVISSCQGPGQNVPGPSETIRGRRGAHAVRPPRFQPRGRSVPAFPHPLAIIINKADLNVKRQPLRSDGPSLFPRNAPRRPGNVPGPWGWRDHPAGAPALRSGGDPGHGATTSRPI